MLGRKHKGDELTPAQQALRALYLRAVSMGERDDAVAARMDLSLELGAPEHPNVARMRALRDIRKGVARPPKARDSRGLE